MSKPRWEVHQDWSEIVTPEIEALNKTLQENLKKVIEAENARLEAEARSLGPLTPETLLQWRANRARERGTPIAFAVDGDGSDLERK